MEQVYRIYSRTGIAAPAYHKDDPNITRKVIEVQLMEDFGWTPEEIGKIPYRKIQEILVIRRQRENTIQNKIELSKIRQQQQSISSGQTKRIIREV